MKLRFLFKVLIFFSGFQLLLGQSSQWPDKTIALIGKKALKLSEFQKRWELMPFPRKQQKNRLRALKQEFVYSLIAEKLLAQEFEQRGLWDNQELGEAIAEIEGLLARDQLYREEIRAKVVVTPDEINHGLERARLRLTARYYIFHSDSAAHEAYEFLHSGVPFGTIRDYPEWPQNVQPIDFDTVSFSFGDLQEAFEQAAYELEVREICPPFPTDRGFAIIEVLNKQKNQPFDQLDFVSQRKKITDLIQHRKETDRTRQFLKGIYHNKRLVTLRKPFDSLAKVLEVIFIHKLDRAGNTWRKLPLSTSDVETLRDSLAELWDEPLTQIETKYWTVGEVVQRLLKSGFKVESYNLQGLPAFLNMKIQEMIEYELLTEEAYRRGLQGRLEVQKDLQIWIDSYLANAMRSSLRDSVPTSERELWEYYEAHHQEFDAPLEFNIREILVDDLAQAEMILRELSTGEDFGKLARGYSKRPLAANQERQFGFSPITEHEEISRIAANMKEGEIYGPMLVDEGYSIFQLLGKRQPEGDVKKSYAESKERVRKSLADAKQVAVLNKFIAQLAEKHGVVIYQEVIDNIELSFINMVTYKLIGFGGTTLAVPYVERLVKWIDQSGSLNIIVP